MPGLASAQSEPAVPGTRDIKDILASKVLRVAITHFDIPAFHWRGSNGFEGPEIDLVRQIGDHLGVAVEINDDAQSFDAVIEAVANGSADIGLSKVSQDYYRFVKVRFSEPYIVLHQAMLYDRRFLARGAVTETPEDAVRHFSGRIGVIRGGAYMDFGARSFPRAWVQGAPNWDAAIAGLKAHDYDAIYRDEFEILRVLQVQPAMNVEYGAAVLTDQESLVSIAICDSCAKLNAFINYHIKQTNGMFDLQRLLSWRSDIH